MQNRLHAGLVIPASPLALTAERRLDERRQRALCRYYAAAGAGGLAVGVHTTQFAIRDPQIGLFEPVLALAAEEMDRADSAATTPLVRIAGVCGPTSQATSEAELARGLGYHAGLLSLGALRTASEDELVRHCRAIAETIPLIGFYLQPSVGGRILSYGFWRQFAEIENVLAIKIAPFNRYQTLDVVRAVAESGRDDIALYTGNDDNIVLDLLTPYLVTLRDESAQRGGDGGLVGRLSEWRRRAGLPLYRAINDRTVERRIVGGLLGHWSVWTRKAVDLLRECRSIATNGAVVPIEMLRLSVEVTDSNAAFFDAANGFAGCIAGLHEVLRRQGLLEGLWCLDPAEGLSPGQAAEIDRVYRAYPHLNDDDFVAAHRDEWLSG